MTLTTWNPFLHDRITIHQQQQQQQQQKSLLGLPAELRTLIFDYTLTSPHPVVTFRLDAYQSDSYTEARPPPITRVSRQLRAETLPIWYDRNAIVLHTEGSKGEQARRWLRRFEAHLPLIRHVHIWLRYSTIMPYRAPSQGVISIPMSRHHKRCGDCDGAAGNWKVLEDEWGWVTVVRRPTNVEADASFLVATLKKLLLEEHTTYHGSDGLWELLVDLRMWYIKEKVNH